MIACQQKYCKNCIKPIFSLDGKFVYGVCKVSKYLILRSDKEDTKLYDVKHICFVGEPTVTVAYKPVIKKAIYRGYLIQCSGLKDKHGKRIYESDILKFRFGRSYRIGVVKCVSTIWDVSNAQIVQGAFVGGALINCHKNSEVIGNIYENSELLKDGE